MEHACRLIQVPGLHGFGAADTNTDTDAFARAVTYAADIGWPRNGHGDRRNVGTNRLPDG